MKRRSAVLGLWLDRPPLENLDVAANAAEFGYPELWIGEMATFDAFALATAVAPRAPGIELTIGPLAVAVRTPVSMAMGAASVAALTGNPVHLAIGSSSRAVVELWHGRAAHDPAGHLAESVAALRPLLAGERAVVDGRHVRTAGYRTRTGANARSLTVAAFGPKAVEVAAASADRMVVNLVTIDAVAALRGQLDAAAARAGRPAPALAVWIATAVDPTSDGLQQLARAAVPYLGARGYAAMFEAAGFGRVVQRARSGATPAELLADLPEALPESIGAVGSVAAVEERLGAYHDAGADEVCLVAVTAGDDGAQRTLSALRPS